MKYFSSKNILCNIFTSLESGWTDESIDTIFIIQFKNIFVLASQMENKQIRWKDIVEDVGVWVGGPCDFSVSPSLKF